MLRELARAAFAEHDVEAAGDDNARRRWRWPDPGFRRKTGMPKAVAHRICEYCIGCDDGGLAQLVGADHEAHREMGQRGDEAIAGQGHAIGMGWYTNGRAAAMTTKRRDQGIDQQDGAAFVVPDPPHDDGGERAGSGGGQGGQMAERKARSGRAAERSARRTGRR